MEFVAGIDEAGYGPNLGPLVMTAIVLEVPAATADPWRMLKKAVRRESDAADNRLLVADSKSVHDPARGLESLEAAVLPWLPAVATLGELLAELGVGAGHDLAREPWFTGATALPVEAEAAAVDQARETIRQVMAAQGIYCQRLLSHLCCASRFNATIDRHGSKGAVLAEGLVQLLEGILKNHDAGSLTVRVDKHGGRNSYASVLQPAFGDSWVQAVEESSLLSRYRVEMDGRAVEVTFEPRADSQHFGVALASMVSKYVRELCMHEFNAFWRRHLPELKATAGYPLDARRWWRETAAVRQRLGWQDDNHWRRK